MSRLIPNGLTINGAAAVVVAQTAGTSGSPTAVAITGAAHTTLAASTEVVDVNFNLARVVQLGTGALTTQRAVRYQAPTYAFVGASIVTKAATVSISGAPAAGTNATLTASYSLWVESGLTQLDGGLTVTGAGLFSGTVTGSRLISTVATGTSPLTVSSTTAVANLNADLLDDQHGSFYQNASNLNAGVVPENRIPEEAHGLIMSFLLMGA